jgi:hypothetical protein
VLVREALFAQLAKGLLGLAELEAHSASTRSVFVNWISSYCTIWTRFPLGSRMSKKRPEGSPRPLPRTCAARRLLVVDDEPEMRLLRARPAEQGQKLVAHAQERRARMRLTSVG